jgi:hypothetical protein
MGLIDKIFGGGAIKVAEGVANIVDKFVDTKTEKAERDRLIMAEVNRNMEAMAREANELEKAYLADIQNSRDANMAIQQSDKASWLAKNIGYLIDIFITVIWGALTTYLIVVMLNLAPKQVGVDYTAVTAVWGAVTGVFTTVLTWHRGSSQGSADKQKLLDRITKVK